MEELLFSDRQGVLSLVGAGGKTSLMFHLARLLVGSGKKVLTTTTTKIFAPTSDQGGTLLLDPDPDRVLRQAADLVGAACQVTVAAGPADAGKLRGFEPQAIDRFRLSGLFDWILVEADGAARRPLKAPAGHEPVIPAQTTLLLAVAGLEVIGEPLAEELVFRAPHAGPLMGIRPGETITERALGRLLAHPLGAFKGAPLQARRFIFLNKGDDAGRLAAAARVAGELRRSVAPVAQAVIVGQALSEVRVHAIHYLELPP